MPTFKNKIKIPEKGVKLPYFKVSISLTKNHNNTDWSHGFYNIKKLHDSGRTGKGVKVAVLDTGVDLSHSSFESAIKEGRLKAIDARYNKNDPSDHQGHGTFCASRYISNGRSVLGFSPDCEVTSYKVLNDNGSGLISDVSRGIELAMLDGAHIISTSLGWSDVDLPGFKEIAQEVIDAGIIWVSASGNDGRYEHIDYPAVYDNVISVGSHDRFGKRSTFSDFGYDLDLYGSGEDVLGAYVNNKEAYLQGTSMATPSTGAIIANLYGDIVNKYGTINREVLKELVKCQ